MKNIFYFLFLLQIISCRVKLKSHFTPGKGTSFSDNTNFGHLELANQREDEHVRKAMDFPVLLTFEF